MDVFGHERTYMKYVPTGDGISMKYVHRGDGKSMKTPHGASLLDMVGGLGVTDIHEVCPYRRRFLSLKTPHGASLLHFVVEF